MLENDLLQRIHSNTEIFKISKNIKLNEEISINYLLTQQLL